MTTTTPDTFTSRAIDAGMGLREGHADVGDVRLHYVEAGDGPLVVLLHGFPEFWYGWRRQIAPLAAAGVRVVAPRLRGHHLVAEARGGAPRRRARSAGLQLVVEAGRGRRLQRPQSARRRPRPDSGAGRRVRARG